MKLDVIDRFVDEVIERSDIHSHFTPLDEKHTPVDNETYNIKGYNIWIRDKLDRDPKKIILNFWKGLAVRPDIWWEEKAVDYKVD